MIAVTSNASLLQKQFLSTMIPVKYLIWTKDF